MTYKIYLKKKLSRIVKHKSTPRYENIKYKKILIEINID